MRDRYKFLVGVMCFGMLLSVSSPTIAQTTAPKRPTSSALAALTGVAGRLDSDRVLGLVRFHHLYELLPLIFGNKDMPNTKDPKELMQLLPMKFRFILQMTGVDFDKGALFAVQTSRFRSAPVPVHMSLWVWMQDPQVLAGLAQMVKKSGRASLVHIPNPKANQDYYLVQANRERNVPLFLLARDRNLLMSTSLGRPQKYARFFETFAPDWLENAHKTFLDALSKHPNAVAKAKDYKDHVKRFGPAQFTLFVRAEKVVKLIRKRLPKKARSLIDNSVSSFLEALGTFDWGLQIAGKRVSMREKLSFVKKGNPFFTLFEPLKKSIDMGNFLPKGTFFFNTTTVRTERLKRFVMKQLKKRMSAKKTHKMLRGYANVRQRILTHFGADIEHDILGTLTGQVGAMMMLHTMEALPLMSTHKGVGVFFGVRDSAKVSVLLARVVKRMTAHRLLQIREHQVGGTTAYEFFLPSGASFFAVVGKQALKLSLDLDTLKKWMNIKGPKQTVAQGMGHAPHLQKSLRVGHNASFLDFRPLRPWFMAWQPKLPRMRGRIGRSVRRLLMFRNQMLRASSAFIVSHHEKDAMLGGIRGWLSDLKTETIASIKPHSTVPYAVHAKEYRPLFIGVGVLSGLTLLSSPSIGGVGMFGAGVAFFLSNVSRFRSRSMRNLRARTKP